MGDYVSVRYRIPHHREPLGAVDVQIQYAVGMKNHKVEFMRAERQTQTCSHSLFPQLGYSPCWYLERHRRQVIEVDRLQPPALPRAGERASAVDGVGRAGNPRSPLRGQEGD